MRPHRFLGADEPEPTNNSTTVTHNVDFSAARQLARAASHAGGMTLEEYTISGAITDLRHTRALPVYIVLPVHGPSQQCGPAEDPLPTHPQQPPPPLLLVQCCRLLNPVAERVNCLAWR
jgi:hypothetical protein